MLRTYEGILKGSHIRWAGGDGPATDQPLRVHITLLEEDTERERRGQQMADALSRLAECDTFSAVDDPGAWQRNVRRDRPLPGRNR